MDNNIDSALDIGVNDSSSWSTLSSNSSTGMGRQCECFACPQSKYYEPGLSGRSCSFYKCPECPQDASPQALYGRTTFENSRSFHRHLWAKHRKFATVFDIPSEEVPCPEPGCKYTGRKDNLKRHVEKKHSGPVATL